MNNSTRFAPSPTGYLHVGSARTALYCWLYAKNKNSDFVLRIEDTDRVRSTQEAVDIILEAMDWLGLDYTKGPFYQTKRFERYSNIINKLLEENKAYRCYCSKEELEQKREIQKQNKQKPKYDGKCRDLNLPHKDNKDYVIRFKNPLSGNVSFDDAVRGIVTIDNSELDDLIIQRTDGTPTYNLTVVIDDFDMNIGIVIRGEDHISNTPRQINLFKALGADVPKYAHIPMILGSDSKRLSKRHGAASVLQYKEDGILPQALLNYLVRLGWSSGDKEIFSKDEMIKLFKLEQIQKSPAIFDTKKLNWLNQYYIKNLPKSEVAKELLYFMRKENINIDNGPELIKIVDILSDRVETLLEMAQKSHYFYEDDINLDLEAANKHLTSESKLVLKELVQELNNLSNWSELELKEVIKNVCDKFGLKLGKIAQPLRVAVTGNTMSPSITATLELIGKARVISRINKILM